MGNGATMGSVTPAIPPAGARPSPALPQLTPPASTRPLEKKPTMERIKRKRLHDSQRHVLESIMFCSVAWILDRASADHPGHDFIHDFGRH
jgi:hypothetical protein